MSFITLINHLENTENNDENDVEKDKSKKRKKNVNMTIIISIIKNVHTLQNWYYSKAMWSRNQEEKKRIKLTIIIFAEKQLLYEISQILWSCKLFVLKNDKVSFTTQLSSNKNQLKLELLISRVFIITQYSQRNLKSICKIRARKYSAYKKHVLTHSFHDKLTHQLHRKKKSAQ